MTSNSLTVGNPGSDASAGFSSIVTLTGGAILNAYDSLIGYGSGVLPQGAFWSIDLTTSTPINVNVGADIYQNVIFAATIDAFSADATSLVPEPGGIGITAIAAIA